MTTLRIATWNLKQPPRIGYERANRQKHELSIHTSDIAVLTETRDEKTSIWGAGWERTSSSKSSRLKDYHRWVMIHTHLPLVKILDDYKTECSCCLRISLSPKQNMIVYGLILPWLGGKGNGGTNTQGVVSAVEQHVEKWLQLQKQYPYDVLCIAGDFNQSSLDVDPQNQNGRSAIHGGLDLCGLDCLTTGDNDPIKKQTKGCFSNIDHICVTKNSYAKLSTKCWPDTQEPDKALSDHFGILVEIDLLHR